MNFIKLGNIIVNLDEILCIKFRDNQHTCYLRQPELPSAGGGCVGFDFNLPKDQSVEDLLAELSEIITSSSTTASNSE